MEHIYCFSRKVNLKRLIINVIVYRAQEIPQGNHKVDQILGKNICPIFRQFFLNKKDSNETSVTNYCLQNIKSISMQFLSSSETEAFNDETKIEKMFINEYCIIFVLWAIMALLVHVHRTQSYYTRITSKFYVKNINFVLNFKACTSFNFEKKKWKNCQRFDIRRLPPPHPSPWSTTSIGEDFYDDTHSNIFDVQSLIFSPPFFKLISMCN